jgi:hypothetical protein
MARKSKQELEELKKKYGVKELYSWSKYNTYKTDHYEYFLKYIKKTPEDRKDGIYGISGGIAHECIENFYGKKDYSNKEMLEYYESKLFDFEMAGLKYDRSDDEKNEKIADKYEACLRHFFSNYKRIPYKLYLEKFIVIKVGNYIFQGYIDAMHIEERVVNGKTEKIVIITDWKTSSIYKGEKISKEKGQLVLYAEGIRQVLNVPLENIIIRWCFLKYVDVDYTQAKGDVKTRTVERNEIASKLSSNVQMWLKKQGYDELEIESYLENMRKSNSLECLPQEIHDKFQIRDCYVEIPLNKEEVNSLKNDIIEKLDEVGEKEKQYAIDKDENIFWQDVTKEDSYRLSNLSGYSRNLHKPYNEYLKGLEMFNINKNESNDDAEEDLSWLINL